MQVDSPLKNNKKNSSYKHISDLTLFLNFSKFCMHMNE